MLRRKSYLLILVILIVLIFGGLTLLSLISRAYYPVRFGISFQPAHAEYLGLDWKQVYTDILHDLKPAYIRLAVPWNEFEPQDGQFDSTKIDWMISEAEKTDSKVLLVIGQKIPRWPECHMPPWIFQKPEDYQHQLFEFLTYAVNKYSSSPALEMWQVENEPFIYFPFGSCTLYDKALVEREVELVRSLDSVHPILMTDSGELGLWTEASKLGDYFGSTLYRVVRTPGGTIVRHAWLPAAFYRAKAQLFGIDVFHRMFISELQAEPWFADTDIMSTPLDDQMKTMGKEQFIHNIDYVQRIGVPRAYLWGVEWWYWMKTVHQNSWYWDYVKTLLHS